MKLVELQGATTAPCGYKWYSNGKSRFNGEYKHYLIKEDKIMTREEKLVSMRGVDLLKIAENLGIKVSKNELKKGKAQLIEKILKVEKEWEKPEKPEKPVEPVDASDDKKAPVKPTKPVEESEQPKANKTIKAPKKANLKLSELTYKGETKSIKEWAAEINMPWPTLYDRVNRNGWPVDEAIETPLGQRRKK